MNNIIQKGGLIQFEQTQDIIKKLQENKAELTDDNYKRIMIWIFQIFNLDNGIYRPNPSFCTTTTKDNKYKKTNEMTENDFYSGFNIYFPFLKAQLLTFQRKPTTLTQLQSGMLIAVDGINIILNISVLIGFLPLILKDLPKYKNNVVILIGDLIKQNELLEKYEKPPSSHKINIENMKTVLINVLPFILINIKYPKNHYITIFQADATEGDNRALTVGSSYVERYEYKDTNGFLTINIPKVTETGSITNIAMLPAQEYASSSFSYRHEFTPSLVFNPKSDKMPVSVPLYNGVSFYKDPQVIFKSEADDATLIDMVLFWTLAGFDIYTWSGDMYRSLKMPVTNRRMSLRQPDSADVYEQIQFEELVITKDTKYLDKQLFIFSSNRLEIILYNYYSYIEFDDLEKEDDIIDYIQKQIIDVKKTEPKSTDQSSAAKRVRLDEAEAKAKYIKYKQKYLSLKQLTI